MQILFDAQVYKLKKANELWERLIELKEESDQVQVESARLIHEVFQQFYNHVLTKHNVQPKVNLVLNDKTNLIEGIRMSWASLAGFEEREYLIKEEIK